MRELLSRHQIAIKSELSCNHWCQDQFALKHCGNHLNATTETPENRHQHWTPCRNLRQRSCLFRSGTHRFCAMKRIKTRSVLTKTEIVTMRSPWLGFPLDRKSVV